MTFTAPTNPFAKDAEAAGVYCVDFLQGRKRYTRNAPGDYIAWLARWAGHWGNMALDCKSHG